MPQECGTLSLRLQIEHERLRNWSEIGGLFECEDETCTCSFHHVLQTFLRPTFDKTA
jgi:hypothetical protein